MRPFSHDEVASLAVVGEAVAEVAAVVAVVAAVVHSTRLKLLVATISPLERV